MNYFSGIDSYYYKRHRNVYADVCMLCVCARARVCVCVCVCVWGGGGLM